MTMKKLDVFIQENRQRFDDQEPMKGHFERFKDRLEVQKPRRRVNLWLVASAAAVAGIILTASLSLMLNYSSLTPPRESGLVSVTLSPEIVRIDEYYQHEVNQRQQLITKMMSGEMSPFETEISQTLKDLNQGYKSLMEDLALSPRPDRAAFVLTRHYQAQLDVLDGIIVRIQSLSMLNQKY